MKSEPLSKSIIFVITFFALTPIALITSVFALLSVSDKDNSEGNVLSYETHNLIKVPQNGVQVYASLPDNSPVIYAEPQTVDARGELIRQYLKRYDSPLVPYADYLVETSDKYGLDFRLLTAIAQQESNLCKKIPAESYNCWGWGIHSEGTLRFESFEHAIETVARGIKSEYVDKGLSSVEEIMSKWIPHSPEGSWAKGVTAFMEEME